MVDGSKALAALWGFAEASAGTGGTGGGLPFVGAGGSFGRADALGGSNPNGGTATLQTSDPVPGGPGRREAGGTNEIGVPRYLGSDALSEPLSAQGGNLSTNSPETGAKMANSVPNFSGSESFLTQGLEAGGAGRIAAALNVNAVAIHAVFDGRIAGEDVSEADAPTNREKPTMRSFPTLGYIGKSPEWPFEFAAP